MPSQANAHVVQLYREVGFLQRGVATWIGDSLRAGGAGILVCTDENAARIRTQLARDGVDVAALEAADRLQVVEAHGMMSRFMRDGLPDAGSFLRLAEALIERARRSTTAPDAPVRAWGEMVNVLVKKGDIPAAQALEDLWNEVIARTQLELLCSYEVDNLEAETHDQLLRDVCHGHTRLMPEESEPHFEQALARALREIVGPREADKLWERFATRPPISIRMPPAEAVLVGVHATDGSLSERLFAAIRAELVAKPASSI